MTRLSEGFESGTQGATVGTTNTIFDHSVGTTTPVFDTAAKVLGSLGCKMVHSASFRYLEYTWGASQTKQYFRTYVNLSAAPAANAIIMTTMQTSPTIQAQIIVTTAGLIAIRSPAVVKATSTSSYTGKWIRLEWDINGTAMTLRIFSGANLYTSTPDETLSGTISVSGFLSMRFGLTANDAMTQYWDGIEIDSVATPGPATDPNPPNPVRISEGFETGAQGVTVDNTNSIFDATTYGSSPMTFDTGACLLGTKGMKVVNTASFNYRQYLWTPSQTKQFFRMYYYVASLPSANAVIAAIHETTTIRAQIILTPTGTFSIRSPATLVASGTGVHTGQWVRLEWDVNGTAQTLRIFSGANLYTSTPDETISGGITVSGFHAFHIGSKAADTFTQYFDGLEIDDTATPGPASAPAGLADATYVWDGTSMVVADCYIWDGTTLVPVDPMNWNGTVLA